MSSDETMAADEPAPATDVAVVPAKERHRARSITATVLGVLSVIVLVAAVVTVWATATILRPEPVAELASSEGKGYCNADSKENPWATDRGAQKINIVRTYRK